MIEEIKLTREEEAKIDEKLGLDFKKQMTVFAGKLENLMFEFPMAQGHSKEAQYLQQPFSYMSGALHLVERFAMTEAERDKDDGIIAAIPKVLDTLAGIGGKRA